MSMKQQHYTLDDLPSYSPWPARLLGAEVWQQRVKTPESVLHEYDVDKWGTLLARMEQSDERVTVEDVDQWCLGIPEPALVWAHGRFKPMSHLAAHRIYMELVSEVLQHMLPASAVVELGCGYGSVVLKLARNTAFNGVPFFAAEYANSGIAIARKLAATERLSVEVGHCDFAATPLTGMALPPGAVVFTSFATPCVPVLRDSFVESLLALQPKAVVHFEPCYEHCDTTTLFGLLQRRYLEVNDYNRNLLTLLRQHEERGRIALVREEKTVFGSNPLLSASVLVWQSVV